MSILIKGMEMPKEDGAIIIYKISGKFFAQRGRADKLCPLVPVQKHGRLIDADALLNLLNNCMFPSDMVTTMAVRMATNWIKEAPTIIEAEKEQL